MDQPRFDAPEDDAVGSEQLPGAAQQGFIGRRKADSAEPDRLHLTCHGTTFVSYDQGVEHGE